MVAGNRVSFSEGCNCSAKSDFLSRQVSEDIIQHLPLPLRPFTFLEFIPSRETLLFLLSHLLSKKVDLLKVGDSEEVAVFRVLRVPLANE